MGTSLSYEAATVVVREDLPAAHNRAWTRLARAGAWWSGAQRVAIATEVRAAATCPLCDERSTAISPNAVTGEHTGRAELSAVTVDTIHRIARDPGRLSRTWFDGLKAEGLGDGPYVELVGVVVAVVCIDSFCRGIGVPSHALPTPVPGEPSGYRPAQARPEGAWVPMIPRRARGPESDLWSFVHTSNILRALSLVPDEVRNLKEQSDAHYFLMKQAADPRARRRSLKRSQMELIAARVSALHECFY